MAAAPARSKTLSNAGEPIETGGLPPRPRRQPIFNLPGVVVAVVVVLAGIHLLRGTLSPETDLSLLREFAFVPGRFTAHFAPDQIAEALNAAQSQGGIGGEVARYFLGDGSLLWWTPVTYAFLHASWLHLGFNCLWLVAFGAPVARRFGNWRFLVFCLLTAFAGAVTHYLTHIDDLQPVIGASAAVSGTMAAAARFVFQPTASLAGAPLRELQADARLYQPALTLRGMLRDRSAMGFLGAWFFANLLVGIAPQFSGFAGGPVAWQAHIGGFLVGLFAFPLFDRTPPDLNLEDPASEAPPSQKPPSHDLP
jgi:membrane associated rhomboid family serine protease